MEIGTFVEVLEDDDRLAELFLAGELRKGVADLLALHLVQLNKIQVLLHRCMYGALSKSTIWKRRIENRKMAGFYSYIQLYASGCLR